VHEQGMPTAASPSIAVSGMEEGSALNSVLKRAAAQSPDGRTVALVFGTVDFAEIVFNWACHARKIGVRWFVLVAMDAALHSQLSATSMRSHVLLLPRVRDGNVTLTKLNVIGERQRFGLSTLQGGFNVVHSDADALWIRDPFPLLADGDIVAERIWGKPLSVIRDWGAGICTGFYYLRSTSTVIAFAHNVHKSISRKQLKQPGWQASDQYFVNILMHGNGVKWLDGKKMLSMRSMETRFHDQRPNIGLVTTPHGPLRLVMLAHSVVPRACPTLSDAEMLAITSSRPGAGLRGKAGLWRGLLETSYVLHCFPPEKRHTEGERVRERRTIFMGHPEHTSAELAFAKSQGLWRVGRLGIGMCM
jgi:hypothetical protein